MPKDLQKQYVALLIKKYGHQHKSEFKLYAESKQYDQLLLLSDQKVIGLISFYSVREDYTNFVVVDQFEDNGNDPKVKDHLYSCFV